MNAICAGMYMTLLKEILITALPRELLLRIFPMIGYVRFVVPEKKIFHHCKPFHVKGPARKVFYYFSTAKQYCW